MSKNDARKSNLAQLHERRRQVVQLHCEGHAVMKIVRMTGMSWPAVRSAIDRYEIGGQDAIKPAVRGRRDGDGRSLTDQQERSMRELICTQRPDQLGLAETMWSRSSVDQLIQRECGLKLSERGVGNYVNRWGFSAAAPLPQQLPCENQNLVAWLRGDYPTLVRRAKAEKSEIQWLQTSELGSHEIDAQGYNASIAGHALEQPRHVLFAVSNQRKTRWLVSPETPDDGQWATFLDALTAEVGDSILVQTPPSLSGVATLAPNAALFETRRVARVIAGERSAAMSGHEPVSAVEQKTDASGVAQRQAKGKALFEEERVQITSQETRSVASGSGAIKGADAERSTSVEKDRKHPARREATQPKLRGRLNRSLAGLVNRIRAIVAVAVVAAVGVSGAAITSRPDALLANDSVLQTKGVEGNPADGDAEAAHDAYRKVDFSSEK